MTKFSVGAAAGLLVAAAGLLTIRAQDPLEATDQPELSVSDPSCTFFGRDHDKFVAALSDTRAASHLTEDVVSKLGSAKKIMTDANYASVLFPSAPGGSRTDALQNPMVGIIDKYIFQKLSEENVAPAPATTDFEFVRRTTLDLTGRIPTPTEVVNFVNDTASDKRAKLVDGLINSPQWLDKWTIWLADLLDNNRQNDLGVVRFPQGVSAFNGFIRTSLQQNKPYNQMAKEMIAATGLNSYQQGELNFLPGYVMGGGPIQDVFDLQAASVAEKFLGLAHLNCLLCHNGRGHLDALSLWGYNKTRTEAYGMASFMSHTFTSQQRFDANNNNVYYWGLQNNVAPNTTVGLARNNGNNYTLDYSLNTQTGNRPQRGNVGTTTRVRPTYIMNGALAPVGSDYRAFLADQVTSDFQFSRTMVNYMWEYFFGIGLVSPSNQFDPMRLDPDNPPTDCPPSMPCTLQASHPRLLNELAQSFINSNYDLKALMRQMTNSRAYQLSARYDGVWNEANERLFARKLVRRLWSEEIHDAIVQSSGVPATYTNAAWNPTTVNWAMQLPEPLGTGPGTFLDPFLRGNRDDEPRRGDPSIAQALALMNDGFVMTRVNSTATTTTLAQALRLPDDQAVTTLYLTVLSRYPSPTELATAVNNLKNTNATARTQEGRNLLWSLYNKVDFIYNY
ncbi:MAG: DUF1549 domain-containing protein [Acidobacteriota bacterium]